MKRKKVVNLGGLTGGGMASQLMFNSQGDTGALRPFIGKDGRAYISVLKEGGDRKNLGSYEKVPVNNATLRYEEWRTLDRAVQEMGRTRLVGFEDLRSRGLVYNLTNPMATTVLTWEEISGQLQAVVSIDPLTKGRNDAPNYGTKHIPIPVVHADFLISQRLLLQSRKIGNGLDTTNAEFATRAIMETFDSMLFGTEPILNYGGGNIYSYLTHPDVNEILFDSAGDYWDDDDVTGAMIVADVSAMKAMSKDALHHGPWLVYISSNYETKMDDDYNANYAGTIRERIMKLEGIQGVKVVDSLPDDTVILVQMSKDVVDLIDGLPLQTVQWDEQGGFVSNYKVLAIQLPRVKSKLGQTGSTRYSGIVVRASESYK